MLVMNQGRPQAFFRGGQNILLSDFDQKDLHFLKCLLSMNNTDIIVHN